MTLSDLDRVIEGHKAALGFLNNHVGRQLHHDDCATRRGGRSNPGSLGPKCDCGLWGVTNACREALTLLRTIRDSAIEVRAWRHGGKHGRWQAEAGPITATDATVHDALLLITPEDE